LIGGRNQWRGSLPARRYFFEVRFLPPLSYLPMDFPDLAPWFDNESDDYVELVSADVDVAYDE